MNHAPVFLVLLLAAAPVFASGTPIDQTRIVPANAHVVIHNVKGAVHVTAWNQDKVRITGTLGEGARPLQIKQDGQNLTITVKGPEHTGWFNWNSDSQMGPTVLDVQVPAAVALDIDVISADADVHGLAGGDITINSVSGDVRVDAHSPHLDVETVSGQVVLSGAMKQVELQTVSGDIVAPQVGDHGDFQTVSGDIKVRGGPYAELDLNTVSGDMELTGGLAADGAISVESVSGDVHLMLPATLSAQLEASSFSGSMHTDFGTVTEKAHGPGSSIDSTIGQGNGHIHIETFSGDVRIVKGD